MIKYIDSAKMGRGIHEWLDSHFHFSFAEYYNPKNINFGVLRVVNDDLVKPGTGFGAHPHRDMEIISYVVDGELTHGDSMGNRETLSRGQVQYMSAGTGVIHSEHNLASENGLRFLQIWILPDAEDHEPNYGDYRFKFEDRIGNWLPIATSVDNKESIAPIKMHQDVNVYATVVKEGESADFEIAEDRQAYMVLIEGKAAVKGLESGDIHTLKQRDAAEIKGEGIEINATEDSHILVIEMKRL
ncbi:MAG: pirin family protein [Clostridiales Family XIII bacterium]|jgi:redox-sensitive bicupin YhaK (pirin superfamily)|nr:pirin family protein [Clostridiales Family XIII bacterium]